MVGDNDSCTINHRHLCHNHTVYESDTLRLASGKQALGNRPAPHGGRPMGKKIAIDKIGINTPGHHFAKAGGRFLDQNFHQIRLIYAASGLQRPGKMALC